MFQHFSASLQTEKLHGRDAIWYSHILKLEKKIELRVLKIRFRKLSSLTSKVRVSWEGSVF